MSIGTSLQSLHAPCEVLFALCRSCYNSQMAVITTHSTADLDGAGKGVEDALEYRESDELELVKQMAIL